MTLISRIPPLSLSTCWIDSILSNHCHFSPSEFTPDQDEHSLMPCVHWRFLRNIAFRYVGIHRSKVAIICGLLIPEPWEWHRLPAGCTYKPRSAASPNCGAYGHVCRTWLWEGPCYASEFNGGTACHWGSSGRVGTPHDSGTGCWLHFCGKQGWVGWRWALSVRLL